MSKVLNIGQGRCVGTARLLIKPVRAVIELGALQDVVMNALSAVHHANRTGAFDDFIAVALPQMRMTRNGMAIGHEVELIGSPTALSRYLDLEGIKTLQRRGMIQETEIGDVWSEVGETCGAYVRDRRVEKATAGWMRRSHARAERRGKPIGKQNAKLNSDADGVLALHYGESVLLVREVVGVMTDQRLMVSTYGFSSSSSPAILPVRPESLLKQADAA